MQAIERTALTLRREGKVDRWYALLFSGRSSRHFFPVSFVRYANASPRLRRLSTDVNGPLLEALALRVNFHDVACTNVFRHGATLVGTLAESGILLLCCLDVLTLHVSCVPAQAMAPPCRRKETAKLW